MVNEATGGYVEGAEIVIEGNPPRAALTDSQGAFFIGGVPAGSHQLRVESTGMQPTQLAVTVEGGSTKALTVRLVSDVVRMERLMVTAQAEGQAQSLNLQRTAENIRHVVSEDALANSRLGEVGEVLQSIPGIYLEASTHQPVRPVIRGLSTELNSVTYDGVRISTWQGTRDAQVGTFPAENLSRVEVMKSVTPDQEGDSIGGSINHSEWEGLRYFGPVLSTGAVLLVGWLILWWMYRRKIFLRGYVAYHRCDMNRQLTSP